MFFCLSASSLDTSYSFVDVEDSRLAVAKSMGADATLNVKGKSDDELEKAIRSCFDGGLPTKSIDCSGAQSAINMALKVNPNSRCGLEYKIHY